MLRSITLIISAKSFFFFFNFIYLFEREHELEWRGKGQWERDRQSQADSLLSTEANTGLHPRTPRSRPELKSDP